MLVALSLCVTSIISDRAAEAQPRIYAHPDQNQERARIFAIRCIRAMEKKNYKEAYALCQEAEGLAHLPENVLRMARCKRELGEKDEAAKLYRTILKDELVDDKTDNIQALRQEAMSELEGLGLTSIGRAQTPIILGFDVAPIAHPGLPPDFALPTVRECARQTLEQFRPITPTGIFTGALIHVMFPVSDRGVVKDVSVSVVAKVELPVSFTSCLKKSIAEIRVRRDVQAKATTMEGGYRIGRNKDGTWNISGRVWEKTP